MRVIKPSVEEFKQEHMMKHIERCGRLCYKSEDRITEDSHIRFVNMLKEHAHGAMLEHGTVYLIIPFDDISQEEFHTDTPKNNENGYKMSVIKKFIYNKYTKYAICDMRYYITTNYRVIVENDWEEYMEKFQSECTEYHPKRRTFHITCNRGVSHEFVRHRVFSFAQESTRYCNYSKDKFSNEITYICPCWLDYDKVQKLTEIANRDNKEVYRMGHDESLSMEERGLCSFIYDMSNHEHGYLFQVSAGWKAQEARAVLPNSLKTELVMTGYISDWKHFFELRTAGAAHPQARELALPLKEEFLTRGYI